MNNSKVCFWYWKSSDYDPVELYIDIGSNVYGHFANDGDSFDMFEVEKDVYDSILSILEKSGFYYYYCI